MGKVNEMKCCVCKREIVGKPHPAPEGVVLCSGVCYEKWKNIITLTLQIKRLARIEPENEKEKIQDKCLESTASWISRFEKQKDIEYIK